MRNNVARSMIGVLAVAAWFGEKQYADERPATIKSETEVAEVENPVTLVSDVDIADRDELSFEQEVVSLDELLASQEQSAEAVESVPADQVLGPIASAADDSDDDDAVPQPGPVRKQVRRTFRVTAYCDRGITAAGVPSGIGQCAAPSFIPFGSEIYIPSLDRWFIVTDRTHERFRHNTIDLFMPNRSQCLNFGRRYTDAVVVYPSKKHRYGSRTILESISEARSRNRLAADMQRKQMIDGVARAVFWGYSSMPMLRASDTLRSSQPTIAWRDAVRAG